MQVDLCDEYSLFKHEVKKQCVATKTPTKLDKIISQIIQKTGFVKYNIDIQRVTTNNSNFLGILQSIHIKGRTRYGNKEINLFVKSLKSKNEVLQIAPISKFYVTELFAYKELLKIYENLQIDADVPLEKRFKAVKAYEESDEEHIIMENVASKRFRMIERMQVVSLQYAKLSIQTLAKFHGLSFVLQKKNPEYFESRIKSLHYGINFKEPWSSFVEHIKNVTMEFVDEVYKDRIEKMYKDSVERFPACYNDETTKVCLCHGDYHPNNILLRMQNGQEQEVIPVDYQLINYGCPVLDFLYFMYFATDRDFRKNHMSDLKNYYYEEFTDFLKYFGLDSDEVYPRHKFEKAYEDKLDFGLTVTLLYTICLFMTNDTKLDAESIHFQVDERFRARLRGALEDYEEWGKL